MNIIEEKIEEAKMARQPHEVNTAPSGDILDKYERAMLNFKENEAVQKKEKEELLSKIIDRDSDLIKLKKSNEELARQFKLLENQHWANVKNTAFDSSKTINNASPESIVNDLIVKVTERQAKEARKNYNNKIFWCV